MSEGKGLSFREPGTGTPYSNPSLGEQTLPWEDAGPAICGFTAVPHQQVSSCPSHRNAEVWAWPHGSRRPTVLWGPWNIRELGLHVGRGVFWPHCSIFFHLIF